MAIKMLFEGLDLCFERRWCEPEDITDGSFSAEPKAGDTSVTMTVKGTLFTDPDPKILSVPFTATFIIDKTEHGWGPRYIALMVADKPFEIHYRGTETAGGYVTYEAMSPNVYVGSLS